MEHGATPRIEGWPPAILLETREWIWGQMSVAPVHGPGNLLDEFCSLTRPQFRVHIVSHLEFSSVIGVLILPLFNHLRVRRGVSQAHSQGT